MNDMTQVRPQLDGDLLEAVQRPIDSARGLPNAVYTDPAVFAYERDRVFSNNWTAVGFASDVPEKGSAMPISLLGMPLMMVRGRDNAVRVFHNVCRHRGHELISEKCKLKGAIVCPYHAWTYALDGGLKGTPNIGGPGINDVEGFDKDNYGLNIVRSHVWMDVVFVDISGKQPEFTDRMKPLLDRWDAFWGKDGDTQYHYAGDEDLHYSLNTNWKFPIENFLESYHLPTIHPELNSYSRIEDHYHIMEGDIFGGQGSLVYDFAGQANIELPSLDVWPEDKKQVAEYISIFPNVLLGLQLDHTFAIIVEPINNELTKERVRLCFTEAACNDSYDKERKIVRDGWDLVFKQDVGAVESMQSGRQSPAYDGGVFSPVLDNPTHHFHQWVARRLA